MSGAILITPSTPLVRAKKESDLLFMLGYLLALRAWFAVPRKDRRRKRISAKEEIVACESHPLTLGFKDSSSEYG